VVHAGLGYTSTLATVRYDAAGEQGVTWDRPKGISRVTVSFYRTLGAQVGPDLGHLVEPPWQLAGTPIYEGMPALFTGDRELTLATTFRTDGAQLVLRQAQPLPLTVRALCAQVVLR
jgi:hypothetical protein